MIVLCCFLVFPHMYVLYFLRIIVLSLFSKWKIIGVKLMTKFRVASFIIISPISFDYFAFRMKLPASIMHT